MIAWFNGIPWLVRNWGKEVMVIFLAGALLEAAAIVAGYHLRAWLGF